MCRVCMYVCMYVVLSCVCYPVPRTRMCRGHCIPVVPDVYVGTHTCSPALRSAETGYDAC